MDKNIWKEFHKFLYNKIKKIESIDDIDFEKLDSKDIMKKVIYKKAKANSYKDILKFINGITTKGKYSEKVLEKTKKE